MQEAKVSAKGWVVIPANLRRKYKLLPGAKVRVVDYGGILSIVPVEEDPIDASAGALRGPTSLTKALLKDRRKDKRR